MSIVALVIIAILSSQALYAFRMILKYFQYLEGHIRNGVIITNGIAAGLIWPITFLLDGFRGIWEEIGPVKVVEVEQPPVTDTTQLTDLGEIVKAAATENLGNGR